MLLGLWWCCVSTSVPFKFLLFHSAVSLLLVAYDTCCSLHLSLTLFPLHNSYSQQKREQLRGLESDQAGLMDGLSRVKAKLGEVTR